MLPTAGKEFDILSHFKAALGQFNIRLTVKKMGFYVSLRIYLTLYLLSNSYKNTLT